MKAIAEVADILTDERLLTAVLISKFNLNHVNHCWLCIGTHDGGNNCENQEKHTTHFSSKEVIKVYCIMGIYRLHIT